MKEAPLFSINIHDLIKGFVTAVGAALLSGVYQLISNVVTGHAAFSTITFTNVGLLGLAAGIAYLGKQFSTNSDGKLLKKEDK